MIPLLYAPAPHKTMILSNMILNAGSISFINFQKLYPSLEAQTLTSILLLYFSNLPPPILFTNSG